MRFDSTAAIRRFILLLPLMTGHGAAAANITVSTTQDTDAIDGFCSLREAIVAANTDAPRNECAGGAGADRILFALTSPATILVGSDLPPVTQTVALRGAGSDQLAIDGQDLHRLFYLSSSVGGAWYLLEDLALQNGLADDALGEQGGGVYVGPGDTVVLSRVLVADNTAANSGGGIAVDGLVGLPAAAELVQSTVSGNRSLGAAGGGGILVSDSSTMTIVDSSLIDNRAESVNASGGGLGIQRGFVVIERSTVSGNAAYSGGGGIRVAASAGDAALTVIESTVYDNDADGDGDLNGDGGGIKVLGTSSHVLTVEIVDSLFAGNHDTGATVHPDLDLSTLIAFSTFGYNLVGANDGGSVAFPSGSPNANGDFVGTIAAPIDPMLEPLALNQGITLSHRPVLDPASPVIDHGSCPNSTSDQRGRGAAAAHRRAYDHPGVPTHAASDGCDIGSVERGAAPGSAHLLFVDGFELGHSLRWDAEEP